MGIRAYDLVRIAQHHSTTVARCQGLTAYRSVGGAGEKFRLSAIGNKLRFGLTLGGVALGFNRFVTGLIF